MASFAAASLAAAAGAHSMPITMAMSGIFGSISMTAWICLLVRPPHPDTRLNATDGWQLPQLYANYKAKNADGLSMAFLIVWLLGDVTNMVGMFSLC